MGIIPPTFKFSPKITFIALLISLVMIRASFWQWDRYLYKQSLVESYKANSISPPIPFAPLSENQFDYSHLLEKKVTLRGTYDFEHEVILTSQKHKSGPGHWLITPMKIENTNTAILVSRGFIPFADDTKESWMKYREPKQANIEAVVQQGSTMPSWLSPQNPPGENKKAFKEKWLFADLQAITAQMPYPVIDTVFLQKIGGVPGQEFPAESISVRVPPQTHYGYTIEWAVLAFATLIVAFLLQAFPRRRQIAASFALLPLLLNPTPSFAIPQTETDTIQEEAGITQLLNNQIDLNLKFKNEEGEEVTLKELMLPNRPLIITPVYYECPRLCSLILNGFLDMLKELRLVSGSDFTIATFSFDKDESWKLAKAKGENYKQLLPDYKSGWHFLTGDEHNITTLLSQLGFKIVKDGEEYAHSAGFMIITPEGRISHYFFGILFEPKDVRLALIEAAEGRIGSLVDQVLLFCFRYDHLQGKYSLAIMNVVRIVSITIFVVLIFYLIRLYKKERQQ